MPPYAARAMYRQYLHKVAGHTELRYDVRVFRRQQHLDNEDSGNGAAGALRDDELDLLDTAPGAGTSVKDAEAAAGSTNSCGAQALPLAASCVDLDASVDSLPAQQHCSACVRWGCAFCKQSKRCVPDQKGICADESDHVGLSGLVATC